MKFLISLSTTDLYLTTCKIPPLVYGCIVQLLCVLLSFFSCQLSNFVSRSVPKAQHAGLRNRLIRKGAVPEQWPLMKFPINIYKRHRHYLIQFYANIYVLGRHSKQFHLILIQLIFISLSLKNILFNAIKGLTDHRTDRNRLPAPRNCCAGVE